MSSSTASTLEAVDRFIGDGIEHGRVGAVDVAAGDIVQAYRLRAELAGELVRRHLDMPQEREQRTQEELLFYGAYREWPNDMQLLAFRELRRRNGKTPDQHQIEQFQRGSD